MAPEKPPSLAIFDARFDGGELKGTVHYVERAKKSGRLRVRWSVGSKPKSFIEVGGGVAYVYDEKGVEQPPASPDTSPALSDENHHVWYQGMEEGVPWLMYILILPEGSTLRNPNPMPRGVKIFDGKQDEQGPRLALFWFLEPDEFERAKLECEVAELEGDLESEVRWISRNYIRGMDPAPPNPNVLVEDPPREEKQVPSGSNPWISGSFYLFAAVVLITLVALITNIVAPWALPIVVAGGLIAVLLVGVLQLRNDDALQDESFVTLVVETLKRLPLLNRFSGERDTET